MKTRNKQNAKLLLGGIFIGMALCKGISKIKNVIKEIKCEEEVELDEDVNGDDYLEPVSYANDYVR